jgi:hypothetical protein
MTPGAAADGLRFCDLCFLRSSEADEGPPNLFPRSPRPDFAIRRRLPNGPDAVLCRLLARPLFDLPAVPLIVTTPLICLTLAPASLACRAGNIA